MEATKTNKTEICNFFRNSIFLATKLIARKTTFDPNGYVNHIALLGGSLVCKNFHIFYNLCMC